MVAANLVGLEAGGPVAVEFYLMKKRIAFIDHDLNNFHADIYEELLRDHLAGRGFQLVACTASLEAEGRAWAEKKGVPFLSSISKLKGQVDGVMILAPSNPETHLALVEQAASLGVPMYVDKTFAPDYETALKIFEIGDKAGLPIESSSALRYTDEVPALLKEIGEEKILRVQTWGGGRSFEEYAIHPLEWAISILGPDVAKLTKHQVGALHTLTLDYHSGQRADAHVFLTEQTPFKALVATDKRTTLLDLSSPIFKNALSAVLDFFESGKPSVDRRETLVIRRILDLVKFPRAAEGVIL